MLPRRSVYTALALMKRKNTIDAVVQLTAKPLSHKNNDLIRAIYCSLSNILLAFARLKGAEIGRYRTNLRCWVLHLMLSSQEEEAC